MTAIEDLLWKVDYEGLAYAVVDWSTWEEVKLEDPVLYKHIQDFQAAYEILDRYLFKISEKLDENI